MHVTNSKYRPIQLHSTRSHVAGPNFTPLARPRNPFLLLLCQLKIERVRQNRETFPECAESFYLIIALIDARRSLQNLGRRRPGTRRGILCKCPACAHHRPIIDVRRSRRIFKTANLQGCGRGAKRGAERPREISCAPGQRAGVQKHLRANVYRPDRASWTLHCTCYENFSAIFSKSLSRI
jgi:hypothetical protein